MVDYSAAQNQGFIRAYISVHLELNSNDDQMKTKARAKSLLQGCLQHLRQSVTRVSRNHSIVKHEDQYRFRALTLLLIEEPIASDFEKAKNDLLTEFPNCKRWLNWWSSPDVASMIFEV